MEYVNGSGSRLLFDESSIRFKDHDSRSNQLNNSYGRVGLALKESRTAVNIC